MDLKIFADIDNACLSQIESICSSPAFANEKVRVMPDAHSGVNSVIGFTSTVSDRAIPNVVGGDIGCGVLAIQLRRPKKGLDFTKIDKSLFRAVDIRDVEKIDIPAEKAKVMTPQPENSYRIDKIGKNNVLSIINPEKFWGVSNFVIIEIDD